MTDELDDPFKNGKFAHKHHGGELSLTLTLALIGVGLAGLAYLWFGMPPRVLSSPLRLVRQPDGELAPENPEQEPGGVRFEAQAGKIESTNSFASAAYSSESDHPGSPAPGLPSSTAPITC